MSTRTRFRLSLTASLVFLAIVSVATAQYSGGSGTADDRYQIATALDLMLLGESPDDWDKHFVLTADIDLDPNLPGGKVFETAVIDSFSGEFDGNGHVISRLTIHGENDLGLFRRLQDGARISNLGMEAVDVNGTGDYIGALVGYNRMGSITMSYSTGTISADEHVGGLVGENANGGSITTSYSSAAIRGSRNVGGLVGRNFGSITACHSAGVVSGTNRHVGGLVGANEGSIAATYSTATVSGVSSVGGLVGITGEEEDTSITTSYSTGAISGSDRVGGLVGENLGIIVSGFWDVETSGLASSEGGIGKTTAEMQTAGTFLDAGWDFVGHLTNGSDDIWKITEGLDYPRLWWEQYDVGPAAVLQLGGDWLATNQNDDGGWDWPAPDEDRSVSNAPRILAPTAMGLVHAYRSAGGSARHLSALEEAGDYLLAKTPQQISPEDGYLAVALDEVFEVTTYTDFVKAHFYEPLQAGTYDYYGNGALLVDTLSYIILLHVDRTAQGVPNLAALDFGMGLYAANLTGAETQTWIAGVKSKINQLDEGDIFDVLGLAGAVLGLAAVGEDFDPISGSYAAAESLADLAEILAGYQLSTGGFTWNGLELDEDVGNETVQGTAIAGLALNQFAQEMYEDEISAARVYLEGTQLPTGAWEDYVGGGPNDEVTGEALWAIGELAAVPLPDEQAEGLGYEWHEDKR